MALARPRDVGSLWHVLLHQHQHQHRHCVEELYSRLPCYVFCIQLINIQMQISWVRRSTRSCIALIRSFIRNWLGKFIHWQKSKRPPKGCWKPLCKVSTRFSVRVMPGGFLKRENNLLFSNLMTKLVVFKIFPIFCKLFSRLKAPLLIPAWRAVGKTRPKAADYLVLQNFEEVI